MSTLKSICKQYEFYYSKGKLLSWTFFCNRFYLIRYENLLQLYATKFLQIISCFFIFNYIYCICFSISAYSYFSKFSSFNNFDSKKIFHRNFISLNPIIFRFLMQYFVFKEFFSLLRKFNKFLLFVQCFFPFSFLILSAYNYI